MITLCLPLLRLCLISLAMLILVIVRFAAGCRNFRSRRGQMLFEIGSERETFFAPGDRVGDIEDYNDEDE